MDFNGSVFRICGAAGAVPFCPEPEPEPSDVLLGAGAGAGAGAVKNFHGSASLVTGIHFKSVHCLQEMTLLCDKCALCIH